MKNLHSWVEIDQGQFFANASFLKETVGADVELAAVIKGNAYGHGLEQIGALCEHAENIDRIVVFLLSDALFLRSLGIKKPILVMGTYDADIEQVYDIDLTVHNWHTLRYIACQATRLKRSLTLHIKVDTGMTRLGFWLEEVPKVCMYIKNNPYLALGGVASHFAESDARDTSFSQEQLTMFSRLCDTFAGQSLVFHIANTGGTMRYLKTSQALVRCGGGLYGLDLPEGYARFLKPILSWKTRIIETKMISCGATIGYNRTFCAHKQMRIAMIPTGYYDGLSRHLSGNGYMYVRGTRVSIVGRVAMNMIALDCTDVPVEVGDEVLIVGNECGVRAVDYASKLDTISYEITTQINPLLTRILV